MCLVVRRVMFELDLSSCSEVVFHDVWVDITMFGVSYHKDVHRIELIQTLHYLNERID